MPAADTNLIVRILTADDAMQSAAVHRLLERLGADEEALFIPLTVLLEVEWVLRARYGLNKETVLSAFDVLLETRELDFQDHPVVEQAIALYRDHNADFAECLHVGTALQHLRQPLLTFDQGAARLPGAELLT